MICNKCGRTLPDDSAFCQFCGSKIDISTVPTGETPSISKEKAAAKILAAGVVEGHKAVKANHAAQPQNEADSQFGLVPEKPIYTAGIGEQERYLKSLRTPSGEPIKWSRSGSISVDGVHGMIDIYDIYLMSGAKYKTIYINMYGAKNSTTAPSGFVLMAPKQKKTKARKPKKPVNKKLVVCLTVIPIMIVLVALLVVFLLIPGLKYNHAKTLLENGNYELAYSEFEKLDGYSDSENMLLECRYIQAIKYRDAGDYDVANKIFESLGNYRDSQILIHKHDYKVTDMVAATCTSAGSETYKCSGCEHVYTDTVEKLAHNYEVVDSKDVTCLNDGYKDLKCSSCNGTHREVIKATGHNYSSATCTEAKKCKTCGEKSGSALGHDTSGTKCSRCGTITFKSLEYSGTGSKVIKNIVIPKGDFYISGTGKSTDGWSGSFYMYLKASNGSTVAYWIDSFGSYTESVESFSGPISGGFIEVDASDNVKWTITIEAIG